MQHEIRCRTLTLTLDERGRAVSLKDAASGYEFLSAQAHPVGLWQAGLMRPVSYDDPLPPVKVPDLPYEGHEWWANRHEYRADLALDSDAAPAPVIEGDEENLTLVWTAPVPGGAAVVALRIAGGADRERLEFRASVSLPAPWALKRVTFPRMRGFGDWRAPQEDRLLYPENWGVCRRNPLEDMTDYIGQYPGAVNWCQMAAWLHGDAGVYLGVHDPDTHHTGIDAQYVVGDAPALWETERWHLPDASGQRRPKPDNPAPLAERLRAGQKPSMQFRVNHWPSMVSEWACPYPVVLQGFTGGWFAAGQIHRAWATRQRWCRRGRLSERRDRSEALAGLDLWFSRYGFHPGSLEPKPAWEFQKVMHELHAFFQMPFGVHWYNWHNFSWHRNYPTVSPVVEGFEQVKNELQARGIVIMPYCQGRLLYRDRPTLEAERTHASVEANGQPYLELYTPQDDWPLALCPGDAWSRMQWREAARMLWRQYGVEGVYFDQITAMPPSLCYHAGHGHALGGGSLYWQGYDRALGSMAPMVAENPRRFLSSELMTDAFMDRIDLYLAFVPPLEDYVPLFAAIYSGYTTVMGRATPENAMSDLQLFAICQGENLLFGGQVGWMNEAILKYPEAATWLREAARLRSKIRPFLHLGTLEQPLNCTVTGKRLSLEIPTSLCAKPRPIRIERAPVVHALWRDPDGRVLLLFLNESREAAEVRFAPRPDWPTGGWTVRTLGRSEPGSIDVQEGVTLKVEGLSVVAVVSPEP